MRRSHFLNTTIGRKVLIALTGVLLFLYLIIHLAGNLMVFAGPEFFNKYSHLLVSNPLILPIEFALFLVFAAHIYLTVVMTIKNRQARPVGYENKRMAGYPSRKTWASSTMIYTGLFIVFFVIIHVKSFRFGSHYLVPGTTIRDLYRTELEIFTNPFWLAFYVVSMIIVGFHLWHGIWSATQSMGVENPKRSWRILRAGKAIAVLLAGGFIFIPVYIFLTGGR